MQAPRTERKKRAGLESLKRLAHERSWHHRSSSKDESVLDPQQARVRLQDAELRRLALVAGDKVDFRRLTSREASLRNWKWKSVSNGFTAFSHGDGVAAAQEVLATGEMRASLQELGQILSTGSDAEHDVVMRTLYKDYIYGAVVHCVAPEPSTARSQSSQQPATDSRLAVKTGTFERSRLFANHEQWCFLEHFEKPASADSFTVTLSSLPEREVLVGKMKRGRVDELPDLTAAYLIEKIPSSNSVRVVFFAQAALVDQSEGPQMSISSSSTSCTVNNSVLDATTGSTKMHKRLMRLAAGAGKLPDVVRRRRFGAQPLADCSAFKATNSRCTCCTKSLRLLTRKKRCHLCGCNVCNECWSIYALENRDGRVSSVRACSRCVEFVDNGDYSSVDARTRGQIQVLPDAERTPVFATGQERSQPSEPPAKALTAFLHDALLTSSGSKRKSVVSVIRHLLNQEKTEDDVRSVSHSTSSVSTTGGSVRLTDESVEEGKKYAAALDKGLLQVEQLPLDKCVLANSERRGYALNMAPSVDNVSRPPMPRNEQQRLDAIAKGRLSKITDTGELDLICELAAREMQCSTGLVTLISAEEQHILASNVEPFRQISMPRDQSFCQHTIMTDKPLLVPHPEADVRFQNLPPRVAHNLRFYMGFPLHGEDGTVVGSFCCLDDTSHDVTQSQYSAMKKLADTASRVVQLKGQQVPHGEAT